MADIDYEQELALVTVAINRVLEGGQDVTYNGRRVAYADLAELRKHRKDVLAQISKQENGGIRMRRGVPG